MNHVEAAPAAVLNQEPLETTAHMRTLLRDLAKAGRRMGADAIDLISVVRVVIASREYDALIADDATGPANVDPHRSRSSLTVATLADEVMHAGVLASTGDPFATTFFVDRTWYARPVDMGGVMLPLHLDQHAGAAIRDGVVFRIEGSLLRSFEGHPSGIAVKALHRVP